MYQINFDMAKISNAKKHTMSTYDRVISSVRMKKPETVRILSEEFTSDNNRIVFSSPLRRLQSKAQVFSLETNASVRSRLTHSYEVATIGSNIAEKITYKLIENDLIKQELQLPFIKIVNNACLLHDIGNPPFGHFAENAIKTWFEQNWKELFAKSSGLDVESKNCELIRETLIKDFTCFDGNPQAVRIVTKLQDYRGEHNDVGFNLTYALILSIVKYNTTPQGIDENDPLKKKAGYFWSEKEKVDIIKKELDCHGRYPLTYIMEAADDISYCLSDIEDGIAKDILTVNTFFKKLHEELDSIDSNILFKENIERGIENGNFLGFKTKLIRHLIDYAANSYIENHNSIIEGSLKELFPFDSPEGKMLKALKSMARKYLFRSKEAENKELAGYKVILGILDAYKPLFQISHKEFIHLVKAKKNHESLEKGLDYQWRLFNRLPKRFVLSYEFDYNKLVEEFSSQEDFKFCQFEWFQRAHLIIDYITGMTDNYSLETYRLLHGIKIR